ncbi:MAG: replicative DNA helicase [Chloracidobacterium sp.]|nr:replicative DNA helicase [Chloracidobacterium sp.]
MSDDIVFPEETISQVPHSRDAEEALLGSVLINPECYYDLNFLAPDDFYIHSNKWVWEAYSKLNDSRQPIDFLTVSEELERAGKLAEIGGSAYLTTLINKVPSSLNSESYARIIEGCSARRKMISAANKIATAAYNEQMTIAEAREIANREITSASEDRRNDEKESFVRAMSRVYDRAVLNAERTAKGLPIVTGIKTGLIDLDIQLLGVENEESVLIAARPGQGKTSLLFDIARHNVLRESKNVAVFSLEMSDEEVARRFLAQEAEVDSTKIKTGTMDQLEWSRFTNAMELYENSGQIFLSDVRGLTPAALRAKCLKLQRMYGIDLVVVDYLQLMSPGIRVENRNREVAYISRQIKLLTGELKVPIFSAVQMSRGVEGRADKRPVLSDLKDSGDLEQDANTVIFLHHDEYKKDAPTEAIIAKRRDGATGSVNIVYRKQFTKFGNVTRN